LSISIDQVWTGKPLQVKAGSEQHKNNETSIFAAAGGWECRDCLVYEKIRQQSGEVTLTASSATGIKTSASQLANKTNKTELSWSDAK
jgi:hypothetical protein